MPTGTILLSDQRVGKILVGHRDRLARFGVEYIEAALVSQGRSIIVAMTPHLRKARREKPGRKSGRGGEGL